MAQGSGSAARGRTIPLGTAVSALLLFGLISSLHCATVSAATTYTVGDMKGWTFNTVGWPSGKKFRAGDVLVFKYNPRVHNLVPVNAAEYSSCTAGKGSRVFTSGNDQVRLARGTNYFICTIPGHCQAGMKVAVTAV